MPERMNGGRPFFRTIAWLWSVRLKQLLSSFGNRDRGTQFRNWLLVIIFATFMVSLTYLTNLLFVNFLNIPVLGVYVTLQTLSLVFSSFFLLLLFSSMVTSLSTQFMSSDLNYLFSTDISGRILYWTRSGEALFYAGWMVIVFGYPVLASYGIAIGAPWYYYPIAFLVLNLFVLVPFGVGNFLVNALMYFVPIRRVRSVLIGVGIIFGTLMIYVLRSLSPEVLFEPDLARDRYLQLLESLKVGEVTGFPGHHAAYLLHHLTTGESGEIAYHGIFLVGMTLILPLVLGLAAQNWYRETWLRTREGRPERDRVVSVNAWKSGSFVPTQYAALFKKELLQFLRQTTQWSQLLVLGGIVVVHVSNLVDIPAQSRFLNYVLFFLNQALIGFVMTAVCVRFVFPSISFEGEYFWIVRSAPISMFDFFMQKTVFFLVPVGLLGIVLAVGTNAALAVSWNLLSWAAVFVAGLSITLTGGALTAGTYFPKFNFDHFGEVVTSAGNVIYMVFGMAYVVGMVGLSILPVYYTIRVFPDGEWLIESVFPATVVVLTLINLIIGIGLLALGARKIEKYGSQ